MENEYSERAKELVDDYLQAVQVGNEEDYSDYSAIDKARVVAEFFICSWFMPGNSYYLRKQSLVVKLFFFVMVILGGTQFFYVMSLLFLTYR